MRIPKLCRHKKHKIGYITVKGKVLYFEGTWPDGERKAPAKILLQYEALLGKLFSGQAPSVGASQEITVVELVVAFLKYAKAEYSRKEFNNFKAAAAPLVRLFGTFAAESVGSRRVRELQADLLAAPIVTTRRVRVWTEVNGKRVYEKEIGPDGKLVYVTREVTSSKPRKRTGANIVLKRLRVIWSWAIEEELIPASCLVSWKVVKSKRARPGIEEEEDEILPVSDEDLRATLEHLPRVVAAMVRLARRTAMRPGELCAMTMGQINRTDPACWWYHPGQHKTKWRGRGRGIPLGKPEQEILLPYFRADPGKPLFSPQERMEELWAERAASRKTKRTPSELAKARNPQSKRRPGQAYTVTGLIKCIKVACEKAGVPHWSTNQLRKAAADEILNTMSIDHAMALLGHTHPEITKRIYAVRDRAKARQAIGQVRGV